MNRLNPIYEEKSLVTLVAENPHFKYIYMINRFKNDRKKFFTVSVDRKLSFWNLEEQEEKDY